MIKGNRVNLRPMSPEDLELFYHWDTNQEYKGDYLLAEMIYKDKFIEGVKKNLESGKSFMIIIEDKDGKPLGVMNYVNTPFSTISYDIGILIAEESAKGRGIGEEAINLIVDYLFKSKNITRIQFMTRTDNKGMRRLGEKTGFKLEGILRKYMFEQGEGRDLCLYSMLRDEWLELRKL